jgi:hypothetical protein
VTRPLATLLLLLSACATVRSSECPACAACLPEAPTVAPRCAPPPGKPVVTWMPAGCPPQFGACLSGLDSAAVSSYMARCSDGR